MTRADSIRSLNKHVLFARLNFRAQHAQLQKPRRNVQQATQSSDVFPKSAAASLRLKISPSTVGNSSYAGVSRQRAMPSPAVQGRHTDSQEGHSVESSQGISLAGSVKDRPDVFSDASDASDALHMVFGHDCQKSEDETRSPARAIPIRGQLTEAFSKTSPPLSGGYARSAPVPVPNAALRSPRMQRTLIMDSDSFVPPHQLSARYDHESFHRERLGCRGLSSLRARNAVFARLAHVGYIDGLNEMSEGVPIDATSPDSAQ